MSAKFSKDDILELMQSFAASGLTEMNLKGHGITLGLKKEAAPMAVEAAVCSEDVQAPAALPKEPALPVSEEAAEEESGAVIYAPLAGTFYRAEAPDAEPYVKEGMHVEKGQIIGLIEAMKMMNEVPSPVSGTVKTITAANGSFAEYHAPLMVIEEA